MLLPILKKIDPTVIYKLTKVTTINPDSRMFSPGDNVVGQATYVFLSNDQFALLIGEFQTSTIDRILEYNGNFQIITKNSGYTLEKV